MRPGVVRRARRLLALAGIALAIPVAAFATPPSEAAGAPLSISIQGNRFVDGDGRTVRLLGANHPSFEYACEYGYAYNDGHFDDADAAALASWHVTAVRIPLNEECWLGINGRPSNAQRPVPPLTTDGYRQAVQQYVAALGARGIYAILDLHWTGAFPHGADGQRPMPRAFSEVFWREVATTFKDNRAVVFDLFNEPYSPAEVNAPGYPVTWRCWRDGGCNLPSSNDQTEPPDTVFLYQAAGMQALVNAVRSTGARQPILLGGLNYANDLSQWLQHMPVDPLGQLAASFHNYQAQACSTAACWNATIAPVAARVPVVTGEFAQDVCAPSSFAEDYMDWADGQGVSYLMWGWWVLTPQEIADAGCSAYYLLTSYDGTPAAPNGTALKGHLAELAAGGGTAPRTRPPTGGGGAGRQLPAIALRSFGARVQPGGSKVAFVLRTAQAARGTLAGQTVRRFRTGRGRRGRRVSLGSVRFSLRAGRAKTVVLRLSRASRALLQRDRSLRARVTLTLSSATARRTVAHRTVTLRLPPPSRRTR